MVKHLYHECMSLEELLEESVNTLGPDARDILAQVRCEGCGYLHTNSPLLLQMPCLSAHSAIFSLLQIVY